MNAHTPGPWTFEVDEWHPCYVRNQYKTAIIAQVVGDSAETEWNAHLIAASPDLLEAARMIADECADVNVPSLGAMVKLCAAIAKAEGK